MEAPSYDENHRGLSGGGRCKRDAIVRNIAVNDKLKFWQEKNEMTRGNEMK